MYIRSTFVCRSYNGNVISYTFKFIDIILLHFRSPFYFAYLFMTTFLMLFICDTTVHDFYLDLEGFDQIACISQVILFLLF